MKLVKYQKEAIVKAIMADVPRVDENVRIKEVQQKLVAAMSKEAQELYAVRPKALCKQWLASYDINTDRRGQDFIVGDADVDKVIAVYKEEQNVRSKAHNKLSMAVHACTTLKQLHDRLPEFKKYYPTEAQPNKNVPALMDVAADLCKLGWPKK